MVVSHDHPLRCNILPFFSALLTLYPSSRFSAVAKELVSPTTRVAICDVFMVSRQVCFVGQLDEHSPLGLLIVRLEEFSKVVLCADSFLAAVDSTACCFCFAAAANGSRIGERIRFPKVKTHIRQ